MCGAFHQHLPKMHGWVETLKDWPSDVKVGDTFPRDTIAAMRGEHCEAMRWGMIAPWSKEFDSNYPTHNARIETVESKPTFRNAWKNNQRCLIPMTGYYEWTGPKGAKKKWYITDKDTDGLVVAGLWEHWGESNLSTTMITREADVYMAKVHHRMLVYLTPNSAQAWMSGEMTKDEALNLEKPNVIYFPASEVDL